MKTSAMLTAIALVLTLLSFSPTFVFAAPLTGTGLELALNATAIAAYSNAVAELKARVAMMIPSNGALNDHPLSDSTESWGDPKKAVIAICADVTWQNCAYPAVTDKQCQEVPVGWLAQGEWIGGPGGVSSVLFLEDMDHCVFWKNPACEKGPDQDTLTLRETTQDLTTYGWNDLPRTFRCYIK